MPVFLPVLASAFGKGTEFRCYFPVQQSAEKIERPPLTTVGDIPGGTETILLVEDETPLLVLVKQFLEIKGYTVITASDGEEGVNVYLKNRSDIDLVLSDIGLPKVEGFEMFERIRSTNPDILFIFASGFIEPEMKDKILMNGVDRFIQKPYQLDEVLMAVRSVLDSKK